MKKKLFVALILCLFVGGMSQAAVVIVDDHFDDAAIGTNTAGVGTGFNSFGAGQGSVTEADSYANLINVNNGAARVVITSKEGAAIGSGITRFEFKGLKFALSVAATGTGGPGRTLVAVKHDSEANEPDNNTDPGFYVQFENDSFSNTANDGAESGRSALIYVAVGGARTVLATWAFDTLNWDSGTQDFTPVLDVTLDLEADGYSLTIEGDTITLLSGSLAGKFAAAGFTNELTTGYAYAFNQTEFPSINLSVDQIIVTEDATPATGAPSNPVVTPDKGDGTVGDLVKISDSVWEVRNVTLAFVAAGDPNELHEPKYRINPNIIQHNIYFQTGAPNDPNLYLYDSIEANIVDPYTHDPNVSYGPLPTNLLKQATIYKWQVEEVLDNGAGGYPAGDPNNILGAVWSFTTGSATPSIFSISGHQLTDTNGNAALTIGTGTIANNYRWFKVVGVQDTAGGEADDIQLTDSGIYSGTTTTTLTITGAASDGSDDARFYAIAYNGDPEGAGVASAPSAVAWVWYPRLVNHYTFESLTEGVIPDLVSGYNMTVLSNDVGVDKPALVANVPSVPGIAGNVNSLKFDNPRLTDPNAADAQYAIVTEPWAGSYKDVTISAWVYSNGGSNWNRILDYGNNNNNYMFLCVNPGSVNNAVRFAVKVAGAEQVVTTPAGALPVGEWTHVSAALRGNTARIYINGELRATSTTMTNDPVSYGPTTQNWLARSQWGGGDGYFNGLIDELKIYNYGLTTVEVAQDYANIMETSVCNREGTADLEFDINDDCKIDLSDFAELASDWLNDNRIYPQ